MWILKNLEIGEAETPRPPRRRRRHSATHTRCAAQTQRTGLRRAPRVCVKAASTRTGLGSPHSQRARRRHGCKEEVAASANERRDRRAAHWTRMPRGGASRSATSRNWTRNTCSRRLFFCSRHGSVACVRRRAGREDRSEHRAGAEAPTWCFVMAAATAREMRHHQCPLGLAPGRAGVGFVLITRSCAPECVV